MTPEFPDLIYPVNNLADAFLALDPRQPLRRFELDRLFVSRPDSPTPELETELRLRPQGLKQLFVGHMGSGKSTELTYLAAQLAEDFISVHIPIYEIYQKPDIDHTELIYAMNLRLIQEATDESVVPRGVVTQAWEKLLEGVYLRLKRGLFGEQPIPADKNKSITVKLAVLAAELETKIGTEDYTRKQVREQYAGNVSELIEQINDLAAKIRQITNKHVILMVDGLEKFNLDDMKQLFVGHSRSLTAPRPAVIYTFPIALRHTDDFRSVQQAFDQVHFLPNFSVNHRDGSPDSTGRAKLTELVSRRVIDSLFDENVLITAVEYSGGHVKTLLQLLQQATLLAIVAKAEIIGADHLQQAARRLRDTYMVMLRRDDHDILRGVRQDRDKDLTEAGGEKERLLYNGSLLEYRNTRGPWIDVNPIVGQLLDVLEKETPSSPTSN